MEQNNENLNNGQITGNEASPDVVTSVIESTDEQLSNLFSFIEAKKAEFENREFQHHIKNTFQSEGLPIELMPCLNIKDTDSLNYAIREIKTFATAYAESEIKKRIANKTPHSGDTHITSNSFDAQMRKIWGLN
jgi:hypothetical protein